MKYNSSIGAVSTRETENLRDMAESNQHHNQTTRISIDKLVQAQMLDRVCLDYYLPFESNEGIMEFLKRDPDLHRRKVALREVSFKKKILFAISFFSGNLSLSF